MEAVQEQQGIDSLAHLEERITRAVQIISGLRDENSQMQQHLKALQDELKSARGARETWMRPERPFLRACIWPTACAPPSGS
jgi:FtsZ-binding cell division protein ZapB